MKFNHQKLKEIREKRGISKKKMADLMGWESEEDISFRESGGIDVGVNELHRLAKILEVEDLRIFFDK